MQTTVMGDQTAALSSPEELRTAPVVSGAGTPTHTPQRPSQVYTNVSKVADGSAFLHIWAAGVWTLAN